MSHLKRLAKEINIFEDEDECIRDSSFAIHDKKDITKAYAMVIGPNDTPYEGGFYFFHITFTDQYPFNPPQLSSLTQGGKIRFNPNLYLCGKVCLSILNTWADPEWSPLYNLKTILTAIRGQVLTETPLQNEPAYYNHPKNNPDCLQYNGIIRYANSRYAIADMLDGKLPSTIPKEYHNHFIKIIEKHFVDNYPKYFERMNKLNDTEHNKTFALTYQSLTVLTDYKTIIADLTKHLERLTK